LVLPSREKLPCCLRATAPAVTAPVLLPDSLCCAVGGIVWHTWAVTEPERGRFCIATLGVFFATRATSCLRYALTAWISHLTIIRTANEVHFLLRSKFQFLLQDGF
jgi:hypothetical protein